MPTGFGLLLRLLGIKPEDLQGHKIYHGVGCDRCHGTGFRGRVGMFEMMMMNAELREMAFQRQPTNKIRQAAIASGMRPLLEDGKLKVFNGTTTLEEVAKHTTANARKVFNLTEEV